MTTYYGCFFFTYATSIFASIFFLSFRSLRAFSYSSTDGKASLPGRSSCCSFSFERLADGVIELRGIKKLCSVAFGAALLDDAAVHRMKWSPDSVKNKCGAGVLSSAAAAVCTSTCREGTEGVGLGSERRDGSAGGRARERMGLPVHGADPQRQDS